MDLIRITAGKVIPETVSLNADEVLLVVIVFWSWSISSSSW